MQSIRNVMLSMLLGAFMVTAPLTHSAEAKTHHTKHVKKTTHAKVIHRTALRSGTMIVPARARSARTLHTTTSATYVPSTNPYDNGHANVINKVKEKWANAKHKVKYNTYRASHDGTTSAAEQRQDARREAQDRAHEAQDRANSGRSQ